MTRNPSPRLPGPVQHSSLRLGRWRPRFRTLPLALKQPPGYVTTSTRSTAIYISATPGPPLANANLRHQESRDWRKRKKRSVRTQLPSASVHALLSRVKLVCQHQWSASHCYDSRRGRPRFQSPAFKFARQAAARVTGLPRRSMSQRKCKPSLPRALRLDWRKWTG